MACYDMESDICRPYSEDGLDQPARALDVLTRAPRLVSALAAALAREAAAPPAALLGARAAESKSVLGPALGRGPVPALSPGRASHLAGGLSTTNKHTTDIVFRRTDSACLFEHSLWRRVMLAGAGAFTLRINRVLISSRGLILSDPAAWRPTTAPRRCSRS
jgi:hypothetical protein